jgi:S-adenosyl-L-methionine hydrolase (adenosine-forming)
VPNQRIVTFTTDFGVADHFVGAMKGVILKQNPLAQIVDISNSVHSFDILDGALTIAEAYNYFPTDTVHLVIVDPGVGTTRRPLLAVTEKQILLAPDNGVLSFVFERAERLSVRHITAEHYFLQPVSQTFHGRDVFAACAGWLSKGVEVSKFGEEITDFVRFAAPKPKPVSPQVIKGIVLKQDKFGNLITNFRPAELPQLLEAQPGSFKVVVNNKEITAIRKTYAEGAPGEVFAIGGSMGFLELATNKNAASRILAADRGAEVNIAFASPVFQPTAPPQAATPGA